MNPKPSATGDVARSQSKVIRVAAGVIRDDRGRILLGQRPAGKHLAGTWEFPGGKCDPQEKPADALVRELREELGVRVGRVAPLLALTHTYPELTVRLILHDVLDIDGHPHGCEGQALRWATPTQMNSLEMPPADRPIVKALSAGPHYAITPDPAEVGGTDAALSWAAAALDAGHRLLQLRAHSLNMAELTAMGHRLESLVRSQGGRWLLNGPAELAMELGADGVHLTSRALAQLVARPLPDDRLVIASCHDQDELARAGAIGADLVCVSPVRPTPSHPKAEPLGWSGLEALSKHSPLPVFALGGLAPEDLEVAREHGAFGVAGISAFASR